MKIHKMVKFKKYDNTGHSITFLPKCGGSLKDSEMLYQWRDVNCEECKALFYRLNYRTRLDWEKKVV